MTCIPNPYQAGNEPVLTYRPGSPERAELEGELQRQYAQRSDIPLVIAGKRIYTVEREQVVCPHEHGHVLATLNQASSLEAQQAVDAAVAAQAVWSRWSFEERAAVFLKAADLLAGPWRARLNAATMLGQSKNVQQAEIDSACELIDFLRFNVQFAQEIYKQQPKSSAGVSNGTDYRPLEGFVYAITPFNFTAIGGNLATAPVLMGNTVVWKPATTAALSNYLVLQALEEAGLPPGVINFVPGEPVGVSAAVLDSPHLAGIHFTGSTAVFDRLWLQVAQNLGKYRSYPRLVGETGGKDFVLAHASADVGALVVGLLRGAFEYQGQKCSAASRAYIPASIWPQMGDVRDFTTFMGAVIDSRAYARIKGYIDGARKDAACRIVAGGKCDDSKGYFVEPTVIEVSQPTHKLLCEEIFGPVLSVHVYEDAKWGEVLRLVDQSSPYALTGAVFAQDRAAVHEAMETLRQAAGNFYINDKPTGAVVGQQPFGGARRSGTNDKAGSALNLLRWVSPRTVKETRQLEMAAVHGEDEVVVGEVCGLHAARAQGREVITAPACVHGCRPSPPAPARSGPRRPACAGTRHRPWGCGRYCPVLRGAPVISAARRTALLSGSSASSRSSTRRSASPCPAVAVCGCSTTTNSPRARCASPASQAPSWSAGWVTICSNCLLSSRPRVTGRGPSGASAAARASMRCGASSSTTARGSAASCCTALLRSPALAGRKPAKTKAPCSSTAPAALSAVVTLLAPGRGTTLRPAARTAATRRAPGSLTAGGDQGRARALEAIGAQQGLGVARVLTGDGVDELQHVQGAQRDVRQVADGRGHHVERALRIMLASGCVMRGAQGGGVTGSGAAAEDRALRHLQTAGLRLLERNYRTPGRGGGEIDLVMQSADGTVVFVEVRQRADARHGGAAASVGRVKQRRIVLAARHYLLRWQVPPPCRFDVVALEGEALSWLPAAFEVEPGM
ncbi:unnamed protein product [Victoria cruziana]